jgi:transposase InsO family protein
MPVGIGRWRAVEGDLLLSAGVADNALMESIIGLFKTEYIRTTVLHPGAYKTIADVEFAAAGWVDWYNHRRLHSSLNMPASRVRERSLQLRPRTWCAIGPLTCVALGCEAATA